MKNEEEELGRRVRKKERGRNRKKRRREKKGSLCSMSGPFIVCL
jgi:hypothetical protein